MKKKIFTISSVVLSLLFFICVFVPSLKLDLSSITGSLSNFFGDVDKWESGTTYNFFDVLKNIRKLKDDAMNMVVLYILAALLPYVINTAILIVSAIRSSKKFIVNAVLSGLNLVTIILFQLVAIPSGVKKIVKKIMDDSLGGTFLDIFHADSVTDEFANQMASVYRDSLSAGFYLQLAIVVIILIVSVVGYILVSKEEMEMPQLASRPQARREIKQPVITVVSGMYQGAVVELNRGDEIIVGRDPSVAHIIINSDQISRKHCSIGFDDITGQFRVTDFSSNGTFIEGKRRIMKNQTQFVPRGTMIALGDKVNCLKVE